MKEMIIFLIFIMLTATVFTTVFIGKSHAWEEETPPIETVAPLPAHLVLFEIAGPTIIVPASVVNESNQTILVKMKVEQWREGYYKLENAPVGGWVVNQI